MAAVGVLNIHDIMFARNVAAYILCSDKKMMCAQSNSLDGDTGGGVCVVILCCLYRVILA